MIECRASDDPKAWNEAVASLPITSLMQSWGWGELMRTQGWRPQRLLLYENGQLLAAAQCMRKSLARVFHRVYLPRGPALRAFEDLPRVMDALRRAFPRAVYLRIEPEHPLPNCEPLALEGLRASSTSLPEYSFWLDLRGSQADVDARIPRKTRYSARVAQRHGITVAREDAFDVLYNLMLETSYRVGSMPLKSHGHYAAWPRFLNQPGGEVLQLVARLHGKPLAATLSVSFGGKIYSLLAGSSRESVHTRPSYLLHMEAIRVAHAQGLRVYDLYGAPGSAQPNHPSYGVYLFKRQFGGELVRFGRYDRFSGAAYWPFATLDFLRFWYYHHKFWKPTLRKP